MKFPQACIRSTPLLCVSALHQLKPIHVQQLRCKFESIRMYANNQEGTSNKKLDEGKRLYYYEEPGNTMNPHTYFYRVLAVPFLKFCGVMIGTYYLMDGLWYYMESNYKEDEDLD